MYHSNSAPSVKKAVLESLANPNGKVRRVFATQSLSMGINCQNFRYVYHWGAPRSLEQYFQEVGRGGRDGIASQAILLFCDSQLKPKLCTQSTIDYCLNISNTCLRAKLMDYFVKLTTMDQVTIAVQFVYLIKVFLEYVPLLQFLHI